MRLDECQLLPGTGNSTGVIVVLALVTLVLGLVLRRLGRGQVVPLLIVLAGSFAAFAGPTPVRANDDCPPATTVVDGSSPTASTFTTVPDTSATSTSTTSTSTTVPDTSTTSTSTTSTSTTSTSSTVAGTTTTSTSTTSTTSTTVAATTTTSTTSTTVAGTTTTTSSTTSTTIPATGSLQISKLIDDPSGGYIGGSSKTFSGVYDCGTGFSGSFSTLTIAAPVVLAGIPAGRTCAITETTPTGGLLNASFVWNAPMAAPASVEIVANSTVGVTITNTVSQLVADLTVSVTLSGPGGYTGGFARQFPASYNCTLVNGPSASGVVNPTPATPAVTPSVPGILVGSVCTVSMTLVEQSGDFAGPGHAWIGASSTPPSVVISPSGGSVVVTGVYSAPV